MAGLHFQICFGSWKPLLLLLYQLNIPVKLSKPGKGELLSGWEEAELWRCCLARQSLKTSDSSIMCIWTCRKNKIHIYHRQFVLTIYCGTFGACSDVCEHVQLPSCFLPTEMWIIICKLCVSCIHLCFAVRQHNSHRAELEKDSPLDCLQWNNWKHWVFFRLLSTVHFPH